MKIGYKLKKIREFNKLSQQEIADFINVCQKTYSNFESCKTTPSTLQLLKLGQILNFDFIAYLINIEGYNNLYKDPTNFLNNQRIDNYETVLKDKDELIKLLKENIMYLKKSIRKI